MIVNRLDSLANNNQPIDLSETTISVNSCSYSGSSISLSSLLSVVFKETTLVYGRDYELTGQDTAINAGTYTAQIVGIGRCTGTKSVNWIIDKYFIPYTSWNLYATRTTIPPNTGSQVHVIFSATLSPAANEPLELVKLALNAMTWKNGGTNVKSTSNPKRSYYLKAQTTYNPNYVYGTFYLQSKNYTSATKTVYFTVTS